MLSEREKVRQGEMQELQFINRMIGVSLMEKTVFEFPSVFVLTLPSDLCSDYLIKERRRG